MRFLLILLSSYIFSLCLLQANSQSDDSPGFFLKITKNVPRLGRRSESYFLKNMKTIPRIGRRDNSNLAEQPVQNKRMLLSPAAVAAAVEREYSVVQPVNSNTLIELLDKHAISSENIKFVHWKDFDRALLLDAELYAKVARLGRNPDQSLKQDLSYGSGNYIPLISNANNNEGAGDFMFYNRGDGDSARRFDASLLQYNNLK